MITPERVPAKDAASNFAVNFAVRFSSFFAQQAVWVENMTTSITQPYLLNKSTLELLKALLSKKISVDQLDPSSFMELENIGVIFDKSKAQSQKIAWTSHLQ